MRIEAPSPIGCGTVECEALSSYVQRLASANGTYPGQLLHRFLAWIKEGSPDAVGVWNNRPSQLILGRNCNAFSHGDHWASVVSKVTGQEALTLTANGWADAFPSKGFLNASLRWCPRCIAEDTTPYHRLLWMIGPARRCVRHNCRLVETCPQCHRPPPVLHERSQVTTCGFCEADLRNAEPGPIDVATAAEVEIGAVIQHFSKGGGTHAWCTKQMVHLAAKHIGATNFGRLAEELSLSRHSVWQWWTGSSQISLPLAVNVCGRLGLSFAEMAISGSFQRRSSPPLVQTEVHLAGRSPARVLDWDNVHREFEKILAVSVDIAPSLMEVSKQLSIARRTLRAHLPSHCLRVTRRNKLRMKLERVRRERLLQDKFASAIRIIRLTGREPSQKSIETTMKQPGLFNRAYARKALSQVMSGSPGPRA